ncbi:hypothetical protein CN578_14240 [Bacillus toyonensis]|nr:hypothetical protein CN578_14240 [Bacillus toyonensis]
MKISIICICLYNYIDGFDRKGIKLELAYIWIKNFKEGLINEQGFTFDNHYRYNFKKKEDNQYKIYVKENTNYIEDFFTVELESKEPIAKIQNVTAIVGQNGAGKSSILEYIKGKVRKKESLSLRGYMNKSEDEVEEYIYIFKEYVDGEKKYYISHSAIIQVEIILENNIKFNCEYTSQTGLRSNLTNTNVVYFSNVYDCKDEHSNGKLLNISTNYLTDDYYDKDQNIKNEGRNYKFRESKRQIQFVYGMRRTYNQVSLPFALPDQVDIFSSRASQTPSVGKKLDISHSKLLSSLVTQLEKFRKNRDFQIFNVGRRNVMKVKRFTVSIIDHIFTEIRRSEFEQKLVNIDFDFSDETLDKGSNNTYFKFIRKILELAKIIREREEDLIAFSEMFTALAKLMIICYKYDFNAEPRPLNPRVSFHTTYDTNGSGEDSLERFINYYEKACINHEFLNFSWRSMSSGEMALLNIYSRFYFLLGLEDIKDNPENDLIILIDEGEVYLHPHWQSQIINSLIEYFSVIFKNNTELKQRSIQIILTSNSPFVVSDLPSTNIIFLKKERNRTIVVDGLEDYHQTFAANIHSLLSHSFFMEDGVTGVFAKRKINEIIHMLVNQEISQILDNEKKIEKTINLIGEPLIRNKLSQMLSDKLSIRMLSVDREIKDLITRLEELERWKGDTDKA